MDLVYKLVFFDTVKRTISYYYSSQGLTCDTILFAYRYGSYRPITTLKELLSQNPDLRLVDMQDILGIAPIESNTGNISGYSLYDPLASHGSFDVYGEYYGDFYGGRTPAHIKSNKYY